MWRSLLLGKLAISIVLTLALSGYSFYRVGGDSANSMTTSEYASWLGVGCFFLVLGLIQIGMIAVMFRKRRFDKGQ